MVKEKTGKSIPKSQTKASDKKPADYTKYNALRKKFHSGLADLEKSISMKPMDAFNSDFVKILSKGMTELQCYNEPGAVAFLAKVLQDESVNHKPTPVENFSKLPKDRGSKESLGGKKSQKSSEQLKSQKSPKSSQKLESKNSIEDENIIEDEGLDNGTPEQEDSGLEEEIQESEG